MTEEKKEVPSDFELMDREDEEQILAELRGVPVDKFIYKNSRGQFELSYAGTKWAVREMANQGEAIRIDGHPKIERCVIDPEYITVTILAKRVKVDREARAETLLDTTLTALQADADDTPGLALERPTFNVAFTRGARVLLVTPVPPLPH